MDSEWELAGLEDAAGVGRGLKYDCIEPRFTFFAGGASRMGSSSDRGSFAFA